MLARPCRGKCVHDFQSCPIGVSGSLIELVLCMPSNWKAGQLMDKLEFARIVTLRLNEAAFARQGGGLSAMFFLNLYLIESQTTPKLFVVAKKLMAGFGAGMMSHSCLYLCQQGDSQQRFHVLRCGSLGGPKAGLG